MGAGDIGFSDFKKSNCLDIIARVDYVSLNLMFNICNNVAPSYMCDINRISHRHNTKHVQQQIRFKKECKALLMTRMREREEMNVVPYIFLNIFILYLYC